MENKLYFKTKTLRIYHDDILRADYIKDSSIDLIITSPPYSLDIQYNSLDDKMSYRDYLVFTKEWLNKCHKLAKDDGRFCLNIPLDKNKGGHQSVYADITSIA